MEDSTIMKMVEDAFYNLFFIIDFIVSDYDSTMWVVLKNTSKGARGQVLKSYKGKLDEEILDLSFLAYPSHRVKVVEKHIFFIVDKSKAQRCVCTKEYAITKKMTTSCTIH